MKFIYRVFIPLSLTLAALAFASFGVQIDHDKDDCQKGWLSMDVMVTVDGEKFNFNPSCSFSFNDDFSTSSGIQCEVESGMCSDFSPQQKLIVTCDDGSSDTIDILCPKKP